MAEFKPMYPEKVEDEDIKNLLITLRQVVDPEIGLNIVDLGLIYNIELDKEKGEATITMTLTVPGCPLSQWLVEQVRMVAMATEGIDRVDVKLVFDPPWSPDFVNKEALGMK